MPEAVMAAGAGRRLIKSSLVGFIHFILTNNLKQVFINYLHKPL